MRVAGVLSALLFGTAIIIVQPVATALTPSEIAEIAQQITVRIDGANTGSGVIIERQGNVYTVVTNWHVVQLEGNYTVHTPDGKKYTFNHSQVKQFRGVDLAIFQFTSNENYRVAEKGNSDLIKLGINISVAGYPQGTSDIKFIRGAISSRVSNPKDGYAFVYDIGGFPGMSGGAILDEQGKLVGIHGRATTRPDTNATTVLGIPLNTYLQLAPAPKPPVETVDQPPGGAVAFRDVPANHWAKGYIEALAAKNMITGFPDGNFRPNEPVTRAQFAAIVTRALTPAAKRQAIEFKDVPSNFWAYTAIQAAYQSQFVFGYPDGNFNPQQQILRVEVLVSLANGLGLTANSQNVLSFYTDAIQIPNYAIAPVAAATTRQLVINYPSVKQLSPNREATRSEVAAFVYQALVNAGRAQPIPSAYLVQVPF
jgi:hypothetical protein